MPVKSNPYSVTSKVAARTKATGEVTGVEDQNLLFAVYPVEPLKKDSVLSGIKSSISKNGKDPSAIDWSGEIRDHTGFLKVPRVLANFVMNQSGEEVGGTSLLIGFAGPALFHERVKRYFDDHRGEIVTPPSTINLSNLPTKLETVKSPEPWKYLLFLAARAAQEQHMSVTMLRFENNNLDKPSIFLGINRLFPELSHVSLRGNDKLRGPLEGLTGEKNPFGPMTTISWDGGVTAEQHLVAFAGWNTRVEFERPNPVVLPESPLADADDEIIEQLPSARGAPKFEDFPLLNFDDSEPLGACLKGFFDAAWHSIGRIGEFYLPDATFAVTVDAAPATAQIVRVFGPVDGNLLGQAPMHVVAGTDNIIRLHLAIFKSGFYARPGELVRAITAEDLGLVVVRGVFTLSFDEKSILAFDRSFTIFGGAGACAILNDHLFVREVA
jgi:hypothetical protein